jgi:ABC-type multidrug transport system fused ATPase/permease subunit
MHIYLWLLVAITFFVFFRDDILKFYKRIEKYSFLMVCLFLVILGYAMLKYELQISQLIDIIQYNIQHLRHLIYRLFDKLLTYENLEQLSDYTFRLMVLSFFVFYPYHYEKKHPKIVYASQIFSVNMIYAFLSLIFCMFCARFGI